MESDIAKMTPEQKEYWRTVWEHMIKQDTKLLEGFGDIGEGRRKVDAPAMYLKEAIKHYQELLAQLPPKEVIPYKIRYIASEVCKIKV